MKIETVVTGINNLQNFNGELRAKIQSKSISEKNIADWVDISTTLDEIRETLMFLKYKVVDKEEHKKLMEGVDEAMDELTSGVNNISVGTPV